MFSSLLALTLSAAVIAGQTSEPISVTTWSGVRDRLDLFALAHDAKSILHKFHNEFGWEPEAKFEDLGAPDQTLSHNVSVPTAVSWGDNHIQLFVVSEDGLPYTRYWSGSQWEPEKWTKLWDSDSDGNIAFQSELTATSWASGRIDLFGHNASGTYLHKYWDGSNWSGWENLWADQDFSSPSAITSWGANRLDIFGVDAKGTVLHQAWTGTSYLPAWEVLPNAASDGLKSTSLTATSNGEGQLVVWAVGKNDSQLYYTFWSGADYKPWQSLGGNFESAPQVLQRTPSWQDLVGYSGKSGTAFDYKIWTGYDWQPSPGDWWSLGGSWNSQPAVASWSSGTVGVFGIDDEGALKWNFWSGQRWEDWKVLGDTKESSHSTESPASKVDPQQVMQAKQEM